MQHKDASSGEMPGFMPPSRPGRELGEPLLDALLEGRSLPLDAPEEICAVAEMLADLAGPAEPGELAGEAAARLGLVLTAPPAGVSSVAHRSARRRRSWISAPGSARMGAALIAAAVGLGGAAAAYAGALPGPMQNVAHHIFDAPPARNAGVSGTHPGPGRPGSGKHIGLRPAKAADGMGHPRPQPRSPNGDRHAMPSDHGGVQRHHDARRHRMARPPGPARGQDGHHPRSPRPGAAPQY
jgi:hypothetical protein